MKTQNQQNTQNKKFAKGFTLLELLVVVVIIGVLAAIALPQYKMAVAKSKYNTIKTITKNYADAIHRYYLVNNSLPSSFDDLDIEVQKNQGYNYCGQVSGGYIACYVNVSGKLIGYYWNFEKSKPAICYTDSLDENHVTNKFCRQETNSSQGNCASGKNCLYYY